MIRATRVLPTAQWKLAPADTVTLDYDARHRRRMAMTGAAGTSFLLDLAAAVPLRDGDGLLLDDGRIVLVRAAPEPLAEITAHSPVELLRLAWHLGNRHLPAQIETQRILIREDHVIEDMVTKLGAHVRRIAAPFDPEAGAYSGHGHTHRHRDQAGHDHDHDVGPLEHDDRVDDEAPHG